MAIDLDAIRKMHAAKKQEQKDSDNRVFDLIEKGEKLNLFGKEDTSESTPPSGTTGAPPGSQGTGGGQSSEETQEKESALPSAQDLKKMLLSAGKGAYQDILNVIEEIKKLRGVTDTTPYEEEEFIDESETIHKTE